MTLAYGMVKFNSVYLNKKLRRRFYKVSSIHFCRSMTKDTAR